MVRTVDVLCPKTQEDSHKFIIYNAASVVINIIIYFFLNSIGRAV